ncbi:hypothetical protein Mal33_14270 [Rosistilla oblonga]|uniref:RloB-like protein n=1 Tax=Rosistilla oblonga TaxID=2527990 RepID=A0A518IQX5_9BACT|nr:hypothetical protein Mal33_14270 [Rosistilla oblonga]
MGRRDRPRKPARRPAFRESLPRILIVTEGAETERAYFEGLARSEKNPLVTVDVIGGAGVPRSIVQRAKELKNEASKRARREQDDNLQYNEVWCAFDVDEHPGIEAAVQMAGANEIQVAISNPCIELWLWLHFADQPGMQGRHKLLKMLKSHLPNYNKSIDFDIYKPHVPKACARAAKLDQLHESTNSPGANPSTGVWRLVRVIQKGPQSDGQR